jgi:hypothetical protein
LEGSSNGPIDTMFWNLHGQAEENHEILDILVIVPAQNVTAAEYMLR